MKISTRRSRKMEKLAEEERKRLKAQTMFNFIGYKRKK